MYSLVLASAVALLSTTSTPDAWFHQQREPAEKDLQSDDLARVQSAKEVFAGMIKAARDLDNGAENKTDWLVYSQWKLECCNHKLGSRDAAETALEELIQANPKHGLLLLIHRDMGTYYLQEMKTASAQRQFQAALDLQPAWSFLRRTYPLKHWEVVHLKVMKAEALAKDGANIAAEEELRRLEKEVYEIIVAASGRNDNEECEHDYAKIELHLAELERRNGNTLAAINRRKECLKWLASLNSKQSTQLQFHLHALQADNYSKLTRFDDADAELDAAEALISGISNYDLHRELLYTRAQVKAERVMCDFEGNPAGRTASKALDSAERAVASARTYEVKAGHENDYATANGLNTLAKIDELRGRLSEAAHDAASARRAFEKAKTEADQSIELFQKFLPADHDILLEFRRTRAGLLMKLGDTNAARTELSKVLGRWTDRYGPQSVECAPCYQQLIELGVQCGNAAEATLNAQAQRQLANERFPAYVSGLTAVEQLTFFRRWDDPGLHSSLRLGVIDNQSLRDASAEWLINGKAKTSEVMAQVAQHMRGTPNLQTFRAAVQREAYALYGPALEAAETQHLLDDEEKTKRDLAEGRATLVPEQWHKLTGLREQLTEAEAYIDCFCLNDDDSNASRSYYAWVITRSNPVQVVKLGGARIIDAQVADLLDRMDSFRKKADRLPGAAIGNDEERLRRECLQPLSERIFAPLRKATFRKLNWIISPDGSLWNVPWAALILAESNEYAVKKMVFRYAISGRDLFRRSATAGKLGEPLIIADPNYDVVPPAMTGNLRRGLPGLPESGLEGQVVAECLKSLGASPALRLQAQATKDAVLELDLPPRILYLATDGFFLPPAKIRVDDPFLCCGLAFAAYNFLPSGKQEMLRLPGLITAAEVLTANLQGTELVVLSACQSGSGVTSYGHSPASLRQAFHLAGAKAVVCTLWSVQDKATKDLMVSFMNEVSLSSRPDKADALRRAQLKMIDELRDGPGHHTHPFFWAAFNLSGF